MTVGQLLEQVQKLLTAGVISPTTPVESEGCDCEGEALSVVAIKDLRSGTRLLVSRQNSARRGGTRVEDLPRDPLAREFTTTEAKGS